MDLGKHIEQICKKTGKQVNAIYRLCNILDTETKKAIYNSFTKANFDYCPLVWAFCNKTDLVKLKNFKIGLFALYIMILSARVLI